MANYNGDGPIRTDTTVNLKLTDSTAPSDRCAIIVDTTVTGESQIGVKQCDSADSAIFLGLYSEDASDASRLDTPKGAAVGLITSGQAVAKVSGTGTVGNTLITHSDGTLKSGSGNVVAIALQSWSAAGLIPVLLK